MKRTRILFDIMCVLLLAVLTTIFLKNYDFFKERYTIIKNIFVEKKVKIPYGNTNNRDFEFKTVKSTDNFSPQNIDDLKSIYYTVLNNGWEDFTFYCPKSYENCYDDVLSLADNNEYISLINNYVSTYNQYKKFNTSASSNGEVRLLIEKLYTKEQVIALKLKISSIINELNIDKNNITKSDLIKVHNYIIKMLSYDEEYDIENNTIPYGNAYNALNTSKAICTGYTDLYALFLDELNIPNFKVASENHIWNVVYFDGKWTHTDVTWDDDEINLNNTYNFFMIDTKSLLTKDQKEHNYNQSLFLELLNQ